MNEALRRDIDRLAQEAVRKIERRVLKEGEKNGKKIGKIIGEKRGFQKGTVLTVLRLYRAGKITESDAMEELEVSQKEFEYLLSNN
ncbi:MAG: hypothetical protein IJ787_02855 [Bacilli bacterium]|nr:hypothetical protein [Bacilli bacterium]